MTAPKPIVAITIGDPAGIGPEISLRAAAMAPIRANCRPVLVGDLCVLESIRPATGVTLQLRCIDEAELAAEPHEDVIELIDCGTLKQPVPLSTPSAEGGRASHAAIHRAIDLALAGKIHAVATAPINKLSLNMAVPGSIGHTEIFGERSGSESFAMMMYHERMAVGLVTVHQPLATVPGSLSVERIVAVGRLLSESVERIRGTRPRLAVLGLNPHAGEGGMLGGEEISTVLPAIEALRHAGIDAEGPLPPDTAFTTAALERYGAHLCLYHDQGLIPFKMLCFDEGVNVTMGLPFPRTSPDHGTAYDIAGKGIAATTSMESAVRLAARLAAKDGLRAAG